jgi:hypothetical protein
MGATGPELALNEASLDLLPFSNQALILLRSTCQHWVTGGHEEVAQSWPLCM